MPYSEVDGLYPIPQENTTIWRYLEPYKFQYLVENSSLYFTQVDEFSEDFKEGILSEHELEGVRRQIFLTNKDNPKEEFQEFKKHHMNSKKAAFISCWMEEDSEKEYMWDKFLSGNNGVVIKSKVEYLKEVINNSSSDHEIFIARTFYFGPEELIGGINFLKLFNRKPQKFKDEQEIRALILDLPYVDKPDHYDVEINPSELVEEVRISPSADQEFREKIQKICEVQDFNLTKSIFL